MARKVNAEDLVEDFEYLSESDDEDNKSLDDTPTKKKDSEYVDTFLYQKVGDAVIEDLEEYIKWHHNHPRSSTPRKPRGNIEGALQAGLTRRCEHDPNLVYTQLANRKIEVPAAFEPKALGNNAEFAVVNSTAHNYEHSLRLDQREDFDDPWWNKSVKDQIYVHHLPEDTGDDGSLLDNDDMSVDLLEQFVQKGKEEREKKRQQRLADVAMSTRYGKPQRTRVSAWDNTYERTQYTEEGKEALEEFSKKNLQEEIAAALEEFDDPNRGGAFTKGSGGMNKRARELHLTLTKYKSELGGEDQVEKMSEDFIKAAAKMRNEIKSTATKGGMFNMTMDFLDACVKANAVKAVPMLMFGADANILTEDEEPVFVMLLNKVIFSDSTNPDMSKPSKERKSCMKILEALVKHGADINVPSGDYKCSPLGLACGAGNHELTKWLISKGASLDFRSPKFGYTAIMMGARYGNVRCVGEVVQAGGNINLTDVEGQTCLHHAAKFGQTKTCQFLLRLGCKRDLKDNRELRAAAIAEEEGHMVTAQIIMGFTPKFKAAGSPLKFLSDRVYLMEREDSSILDRLGNAIGGMFGFGGGGGGSVVDSKDLKGPSRDGRGRLERWWDNITEWFEKLFDGSVGAEDDQQKIDSEWQKGEQEKDGRDKEAKKGSTGNNTSKNGGKKDGGKKKRGTQKAIHPDVVRGMDSDDEM